MEPVRIVAVGPHPDDVESTIGGTVALATQAGYEVAILCPVIAPELTCDGRVQAPDLTHPRLEEAHQGAEALGARLTVIPLYPYMEDTQAYEVLVETLRTHRPQIVLVNHAHDSHPFHAQVGRWLIDACFLAQLATVPGKSDPWTVAQIYTYGAFTGIAFTPDIFIDVTPTFATARRALRCHRAGLAMLPGLAHWSEATRVHYGLQMARPYAEGFVRMAGVPWDHLPHRLVGMRFILDLNELAARLAAGR